MRIFRPVSIATINQGFGENKNPLYAQLGLKGHNGVDFGTPIGTPLYWNADCRGTIYRLDYDELGGNFIDVITEDQNGIFKHTFYHLNRYADGLKVGDSVDTGTLIGYTGNSGKGTTGPHLHDCEIKPMGKDSQGNYYKLQPLNGYLGAIDPKPYFENVFVLDKLNNLNAQVNILQKLIGLFKLLKK